MSFLELDTNTAVSNMRRIDDPVCCESKGCKITALASKLHAWDKKKGFRCPACKFLLEHTDFGAIVVTHGYVDFFFRDNPVEPMSSSEFKSREIFQSVERWARQTLDQEKAYHWGMRLRTKAYANGPFPWNDEVDETPYCERCEESGHDIGAHFGG